MVIGLDSAPPELILDRWREELPNLNRLMSIGSYSPLQSTIPPITCPAWMSMLTGKDPGRLGIYGFRNKLDHSYDNLIFATSRIVDEDTVWDILGRHGYKCIVLGVPQTYPPKKLNGWLISGFLTPGIQSRYTYPAELKDEIEDVVGEYIFDVERSNHEDEIKQIYEMTEKRFKLADHLLKTREWDFFMIVEMGTDRLQHYFWKYFDETHPGYTEGNPYRNVVRDYYQYVDEQIGKLLNHAGEETLVLVVSDHGAQKMQGGVAINEWLMDKGYLVLKKQPAGITSISESEIDWSNTKAWGYGGYYGRIFLNLQGREPRGVVPPSEYESLRDRLTDELKEMTDKQGRKIKNTIFKPEEIYSEAKNVPPDLMVYFGNLQWRSIGSVGHGKVFVDHNDLEPVYGNHSPQGIFIASKGAGTALSHLDIKDVAATVLGYMGIEIPSDMQGRNVLDL